MTNLCIDLLTEPFLTQYYLADAVCGRFMLENEREDMFFELANLFCINNKKVLNRYYDESMEPVYKDITDLASYERLCRTIEYAKKSNQAVELSEIDNMILAQKREAMSIKSMLFKQSDNITKETIYTTLLTTAKNGNIYAMGLLSYMEYHGICVLKDERNAIKRMKLCAKWNNLFGIMMGIKYDPENSQEYFNILYTIFRNAGQKEVFNHICSTYKYENSHTKDPVSRIIEKAFETNIIKRNAYDRAFARVAFSQLISSEDKEKILLNRQEDAITSLSNFPFDAKGDENFVFDESVLDNIPLVRSSEIKRIKQNIAIARDCPKNVYMPLLIVSQDEYVTSMYTDAIKKGFSGMSVFELDGGTLSSRDFYPTKENVFLRGISETKTTKTVFFIKDCEELSEECAKELTKSLDYEYRKKFKFFEPSVSIDLSGMLFVLMANNFNTAVKTIFPYCDVLEAQKVQKAEKTDMIKSVFSSRRHLYGCDRLSMDDEGLSYLAEFEPEKAVRAIDCIIKNAIFEKSSSISVLDIKNTCKEQNIEQARRGFGYTGGNTL